MLLAVLSSTVIADPNIVPCVDQLEVERLMIPKVGDPRGTVLMVAMLDQNGTLRRLLLALDMERS